EIEVVARERERGHLTRDPGLELVTPGARDALNSTLPLAQALLRHVAQVAPARGHELREARLAPAEVLHRVRRVRGPAMRDERARPGAEAVLAHRERGL